MILLKNIVEALDSLPTTYNAYLHRKTAEILKFSDDDLSIIEDDEDTDHLSEWQLKDLAKLRQILESEDWLSMPTRFDIHERSIMERYCAQLEDKRVQTELTPATKGKAAFRNFKNAIKRLGVENDWYSFKAQALEGIAVAWLDKHKLEYQR